MATGPEEGRSYRQLRHGAADRGRFKVRYTGPDRKTTPPA